MLERWLSSCPELELVALDVAPGRSLPETRVPVSPLALRLRSSEERLLLAALDYIAAGNTAYALEAAAQAPAEGAQLPDLYLLQGALLLAEGRIDEALEPLRKAYVASIPGESAAGETARRGAEPFGLPSRRLYPFMRMLVRIAPTQLVPVYPDAYGAALLYAVALWRSGSTGEALELLRECVREEGLIDELRVLGGQLHLTRGDLAKAITALTESPEPQRDALDFVRALYFALAQKQSARLREAARELRPAVLHTSGVNPHSLARARVLLATIYADAGFPLEALRHSGAVQPAELPQFAAAWLGGCEAQWVDAAAALSEVDLERMARADVINLRIPDASEVLNLEAHKLDSARDPLRELKPTEMSWTRRREQEAQIGELRAAAARGETSTLGEAVHSSEAREYLNSVRRMQQWWEARRSALKLHGPETLARDPQAAGHVRFDFRGTRAAPVYNLPCERRLALLLWAAGATLALLCGLLLLRAWIDFV